MEFDPRMLQRRSCRRLGGLKMTKYSYGQYSICVSEDADPDMGSVLRTVSIRSRENIVERDWDFELDLILYLGFDADAAIYTYETHRGDGTKGKTCHYKQEILSAA